MSIKFIVLGGGYFGLGEGGEVPILFLWARGFSDVMYVIFLRGGASAHAGNQKPGDYPNFGVPKLAISVAIYRGAECPTFKTARRQPKRCRVGGALFSSSKHEQVLGSCQHQPCKILMLDHQRAQQY